MINDIVPWNVFCSLKEAPNTLGYFMVPILGFNFIVLLLVSAKGFRVYFQPNDSSSILVKVYKDTFPYFLA